MSPRAFHVLVAATLLACGSFGTADGPMEGGVLPSGAGEPGDSGAPGADAAPRFCQGKTATFCDDFDAVARAEEAWDDSKIEGTATLDPTDPSSPPHALRLTLPPNPSTTTGTYCHLDKDFPRKTWGTSRLEMDVRFRKADWQVTHAPDVAIALSSVSGSSGPFFKVYLIVTKDGDTQVDVAEPVALSFTGTVKLPFDKWVNVVLDVAKPVGGTLALRLVVDGKISVEQAPAFAFAPPAVEKMSLSVGLHGVRRPTPAFDVRYDNVVYQLE